MRERWWKRRRPPTPPIQACPEWRSSPFTLDFGDHERRFKGGGWPLTIFLSMGGIAVFISGIVASSIVRMIVGPLLIVAAVVLFKLDRWQCRQGK